MQVRPSNREPSNRFRADHEEAPRRGKDCGFRLTECDRLSDARPRCDGTEEDELSARIFDKAGL
jgi:hypothetical protein